VGVPDGPARPPAPARVVAIDFETANENPGSACAVGVAAWEAGRLTERHARLVRPARGAFLPRFVQIHGISAARVETEPVFGDHWRDWLGILVGRADVVVAHNVSFDRRVLLACLSDAVAPCPPLNWACTLALSQRKWGRKAGNKLPEVCQRLGIRLASHHHAGRDAEACLAVYLKLSGLEATCTL
jgi:DNA polymerase-3 subunit epsilon